MSVYRRSIKCRLSYIFLFAASVIIVLLGVFCYQLSVHIDEISRYESKLLAMKIINSAVEKAMSCVSSDDLIVDSSSKNNEIYSLALDPQKTNKINYIISDTINSKLKEYEDEGFKVPIGTLSGITFLNGRGFDLELRLHQLGAVSTKMRSEFVSCGVNQSKYRVYVEIKVELSAVLPVSSTDVCVEHEYLIAEKIIVGKVPNTYFSV